MRFKGLKYQELKKSRKDNFLAFFFENQKSFKSIKFSIILCFYRILCIKMHILLDSEEPKRTICCYFLLFLYKNDAILKKVRSIVIESFFTFLTEKTILRLKKGRSYMQPLGGFFQKKRYFFYYFI